MTKGEEIRKLMQDLILKAMKDRGEWISRVEISRATDLDFPLSGNKGYVTWSALMHMLDTDQIIDNGEKGRGRKFKIAQ